MMCSNIPYVCTEEPASNEDSFATGLRAAGDLPWVLDKGWGPQPQLVQDTGAVVLRGKGSSSYLLGSLCPVSKGHYVVSAQLRWPVWLPGPQRHVGLAFGQQQDWPYRVGTASAVSGYHVILRVDGTMELYAREAGEDNGTKLGGISTAEIHQAEWASIAIEVTPDSIRVTRDENISWVLQVDNQQYRGGYLSVCKNYDEALPVEFRSIAIA